MHLTDEQLGVECRRILFLKAGSQSRTSQLLSLANQCEAPAEAAPKIAPRPKLTPKAMPSDPRTEQSMKTMGTAEGAAASEPVKKKTTRKKKAATKKEY